MGNYKFVEKFKLLSPISTKMPAGPDETDNHAPGAATEHTAKHASSKTETNASTILSMTRASQRATKSSSSMPNRVQLFPSNAFPRVQNMIVGGHIRFGNMALVKVVTCKRDLVDLHGG